MRSGHVFSASSLAGSGQGPDAAMARQQRAETLLLSSCCCSSSQTQLRHRHSGSFIDALDCQYLPPFLGVFNATFLLSKQVLNILNTF